MAKRISLLEAGRRAAEILDNLNVRDRIDAGYTRVDPVEIAFQSDVTVVFRSLEKLLGAFIDDEQPGILVNVARPRGLVHMTCAHELGHYFLGHETMADVEIEYGIQSNMVERQADQFAYSLMAPRWLITKLSRIKNWSLSSFRNPINVYQLSLRLGISFTAAVWSLNRHGFLSDTDASTMVKTTLRTVKENILGTGNGEDWRRDVWLLDERDQQFILEPTSDDSIVVKLPSHAAAGYLWTVDEANAEGFHLEPQLVSQDENTAKIDKDDLVVGSIAYTQYRLFNDKSEQKDGEHKVLSLLESQPWLSTSPENDRYEIKTEYEILNEGLSALERERRVQGDLV
jgi:Zn-dependent peptidase ImmA (M78 family)